MKRFFVFTVISLLLVITAYGSSEGKLEKVSLKIEGMATACCVPKAEDALLKVKGVKKVSACFKRGIAEVEMGRRMGTVLFS